MKKLIMAIVIIMMVLSFVGCTEAERVSQNISQEADNFNITRKLTDINQRTDTILFEMIGNFSIQKEADGDLAVVGENPDGTFYKHFVYLSGEISYISEQLIGKEVSKYSYEINFNPKLWIMNTPDIID
jgi:hypothetical protein